MDTDRIPLIVAVRYLESQQGFVCNSNDDQGSVRCIRCLTTHSWSVSGRHCLITCIDLETLGERLNDFRVAEESGATEYQVFNRWCGDTTAIKLS